MSKGSININFEVPTERLDEFNGLLDKFTILLQLIEANPQLFSTAPPPRTLIDKNIFISYRRDDSAYVTGRIHEHLAREFGDGSIFRDVDDILAGRNFTQQLEHELARCNLMLVIIGRDWLGIRDGENGERRLDNPNDIVRLEIETALARRIPVIPILVRGASIPPISELPLVLKPLNNLAGTVIKPDPSFDDDVRRLIRQIKDTLELE